MIWHEAEKHKSPTADWVDDVTADRDIVIVLTEHIGHALSGRVIDACKRRGVTWIPSKTGERWVLEAIGVAAGSEMNGGGCGCIRTQRPTSPSDEVSERVALLWPVIARVYVAFMDTPLFDVHEHLRHSVDAEFQSL